MDDERAIAERYRLLVEQGRLDERARRRWAAAQARAAGFGGIAAVARATGISQSTIRRGLLELDRAVELEPGRVRRPGAGRPAIAEREPGLVEDLERLIDPLGRDPQEPALRWTCNSAAALAKALRERGHSIVDRTVLRLLAARGYSLQANRRSRDGSRRPDRDAQFEYINRTVEAALVAAEPAICVEVKRSEPGGGCPQVGITDETARLTANVIDGWWERIGLPRSSGARALTVIADFAGPESDGTRTWMVELQRLSNRLRLELVVRHFPAATTRWNATEHRLLGFIGAAGGSGDGAIDYEVVVSAIARPTACRPIRTWAWLQAGERPTGAAPPDRRPATLNVARSAFQGDWNYSVKPFPINN